MPYCRKCGYQLQEADTFCEACGTARGESLPSAKYVGKTCPFCQYPLKADLETVECPSCKVPHHRECWEENGGCTTFGCREKNFRPAEAGELLEISDDEAPGQQTTPARGGGNNKLLVAVLVTTLLGFFILFFAYINLLGDRTAVVDDPATSPGETEAEEAPQTFDADVIAGLEADYYIDYESGTIPIGDLYIGARVVDPSWEWEFRTGRRYSREFGDDTKPVTWLVVAKDHYSGLDPHVTLLTEELIGRFPFDDSTDRGSSRGSNHWGDSGTTNASRGLRPWLNSTSIHAGEGFYRAFSESFKRAVHTTTVPNKEWQSGSAYTTSDNVFIPSTTELGDTEHNRTYPIGTTYVYFQGAGDAKRVAMLGGDARWYWTRSPASRGGYGVRYVSSAGGFSYRSAANRDGSSVRPALNLKSEILVSEINP